MDRQEKIAAIEHILSSEHKAEIRKLSDQQLEFIVHQLDSSCFLEACPGSGKTEVIGIKGAYEIAKWQKSYSGIALLSFTNNATKEIADRVRKYAGPGKINHPHYIGTIDSWLHGYILQPFGYSAMKFTSDKTDKTIQIIESDSQASFLHNGFSIGLKKNDSNKIIRLLANQYYYTAEGKIDSIKINLKNISEEQKADCKKLKKRFYASGFATYSDAESIVNFLLKRNTRLRNILAQRFPIIMIDECQDLSDTQLSILQRLFNEGVKIHLVGDYNQSIYLFKRVNPKKIIEFATKNNLSKLKLTNNYRSNQEIVEVCKKIISDSRNIQGKEAQMIRPCCILWEYEKDDFQNLLERFKTRLQMLGFSPKKSALVARGRTTLRKFRSMDSSQSKIADKIATALRIWNKPNKSLGEKKEAIELIGKTVSLLAYKGKGHPLFYYSPQGIPPFIWRNLLFQLLEEFNSTCYPFKDEKGNSLSYSTWMKKVKSAFQNKWSSFPFCEVELSKAMNKLKSPQRAANKPVPDAHYSSNGDSLRITTIHDVKGETFDAILFVSSPDKRSKGGYFEHWFTQKPDEEEFRRFAYVACSRPKHLLIVAVPKQKDQNQLNVLLEAGFILEQ